MRFAIRDDDTNFFTTPEELQYCYGDVWNEFPITLCLISKVKGNWKHWVHQIYQTRHNTDWQAWHNDDTIYPIEYNPELLVFLRDMIQQNKLDIAFHAKHHRNEDSNLPEERYNNYVRGAEFFTNRNLTQYIKDEVAHLNELFQHKISVFTPPQNLLSMKGYQSVIKAGLNICGGGIAFYKKEKTPKGLINIAKQLSFRALHGTDDYPYVLRYSNHNEVIHHYPLQPNTKYRELINDFEMVRRYDGDFVLSTHYVEMNYPMVDDEKKTMKQVLMDFMDYISKYNVRKMSLSELLK